MQNFSENHILKICIKSTVGKNNYMQIIGKKSWILEFDLFLIIYYISTMSHLHIVIHCVFDKMLVLNIPCLIKSVFRNNYAN